MIKIFIDFDGTISRLDVGDALFETFGGARSVEAVEAYRAGRLSAVECFRQECDACGEIEPEALKTFLDRQEIDPSFVPFVEFCRARSLDHYILSDGMDYYIRYILGRYGVGDVPLHSNTLSLVPAEGSNRVRFVPSFPNTDETCDRCASCKRNHMLSLAADEEIIVYIGEGYSDRCPARYADIVFAKDDLLVYCQKENIPYYAYASFAEIQSRLSDLLARNGSGSRHMVKKRKQAELARRELYLGG